MEVWVQGMLFESPAEGMTPRGARRMVALARPDWTRYVVRGGWSPVTRDPAVAASHSEGARLAGDIRVGLARSLDRLSPELRQSIRAALGPPRSPAAA